MKTLGILGGGQLALMLGDAAFRLGYNPIFLTENAQSSVCFARSRVILGSMDQSDVLHSFLSQTNRVIFENELINCELLMNESVSHEVEFIPKLKVISTFQNKIKQKILLKELNIPTLDYVILDPFSNHLKQKLSQLFEQFNHRYVLKWAQMGYDGKGVFVMEDTPGCYQQVQIFLEKARQNKTLLYAEPWVHAKTELAMVAVFSTQNEFIHYPLVITEQKNGICSRVYGPATQLGVPLHYETLAAQYLKKIAQSQNLFGSFAVEFFETQEGEFLVNEIASRVHNSGHYTQNASKIDQFENHIRAVLGFSLGEVECAPGFAMINLLGPDQVSGGIPCIPSPTARQHLHWYEKQDTRPNRKLGHLTSVVQSIAEVPMILEELEHSQSSWIQACQKGSSTL